MKNQHLFLGIALGLFGLGCNQSYEDQQVFSPSANNQTEKTAISSSAAVENAHDATRKFIRTADIKCRVADVVGTTYDIEHMVTRQGGFVAYTHLASEINQVNRVVLSPDSLLETTHYTVTNSMILRVPNSQLDTTLKQLSRNIDYLDYRIIKADDVAIQILANKQTQNRLKQQQQRLEKAIDNQGRKLTEIAEVEGLLQSKQQASDEAEIANLMLADKIQFSTINLFLYQRQAIKHQLLANEDKIEAYEPGFGSKILASLHSGWQFFEMLVIFLVKQWFFFLVMGLAIWLYWRFGKGWRNRI